MRVEIGLVELLGIDAILNVQFSFAAVGGAAGLTLLAGGLDAEDDEAVLTGELLLRQDAVVDERRGGAQLFRLARRPRLAVGEHIALSAEAGAVPHDLLRPHDVVENVAVVEAVDVVLQVVEDAALSFEYVVP